MKQANIDYLETNRDAYEEIIRAETAVKAHKIHNELLRILREEFFPNYLFIASCGDCLFTMVKTLYQHYDQWKAQQPKIITEEPLVVATGFPKNDKPKRRR